MNAFHIPTQAIEKQAHKAIGRKFLLSSTKQLREILFEELQLDTGSILDFSAHADPLQLEKLLVVPTKVQGRLMRRPWWH